LSKVVNGCDGLSATMSHLQAVVDWDVHGGVLVVDELDRCTSAATTDEFRR